jgi:hypothetical protein
MIPMVCVPPLCCRFTSRAGTLCALLVALSLPAVAAPSEGTAGQTVTGRSLHRHDSTARGASTGTLVAAAPAQSKPAWKDLTPAQQQALQPLASHWDHLPEQRKLKWLAVSKNYPTMSSEEQVKLHLRMSKWAALSQQQRTQARQNFKEIKSLNPEQKASEWEAYQALSAEEKRKLANQARNQPPGLTTVKPGVAPKLSQVPRRASARPHMAEAALPVQQNTLLPRMKAGHSEVERSPYEDEPAE